MLQSIRYHHEGCWVWHSPSTSSTGQGQTICWVKHCLSCQNWHWQKIYVASFACALICLDSFHHAYGDDADTHPADLYHHANTHHEKSTKKMEESVNLHNYIHGSKQTIWAWIYWGGYQLAECCSIFSICIMLFTSFLYTSFLTLASDFWRLILSRGAWIATSIHLHDTHHTCTIKSLRSSNAELW